MPTIQVNATAIAAIAGLLALAIGGVYVWKRFDLATKLNPANPDNIINAPLSRAASALAGRDESAGTLAYEAASSPWLNPLAAWRKLTGKATTDDIDYSAPVTASERQLVQSRNVKPADMGYL